MKMEPTLRPCRAGLGALLAIGVMTGAIFCHLWMLGIVVKDDGGLLFRLAVTVFVCSLATLYLHRRQITVVSELQNRNRHEPTIFQK